MDPSTAPAEPKMPDPTGELSVTVKGNTYVLRPSFRFLRRVEDATDRAVTELIGTLGAGKVRVSHVAIILHHGILEGGDRPPSVDVIGEWLCEDQNLSEVVVPVTRLLVGAITAKSKP